LSGGVLRRASVLERAAEAREAATGRRPRRKTRGALLGHGGASGLGLLHACESSKKVSQVERRTGPQPCAPRTTYAKTMIASPEASMRRALWLVLGLALVAAPARGEEPKGLVGRIGRVVGPRGGLDAGYAVGLSPDETRVFVATERGLTIHAAATGAQV